MAMKEIKVPDLEGSSDVEVVEVYVSPGERVEKETPLISLESDKAVVDVPSPLEGTITELKVSEGDRVNSGDLIALAESSAEGSPKPDTAGKTKTAGGEEKEATKPTAKSTEAPRPADSVPPSVDSVQHATPSVRQFARELGVELSRVAATGPKGRILREDVTAFVKSLASGHGSSGGFQLPPIPTADFAGPVEKTNLSRIQKISGPHLHRNWLGLPHVTQFEETDVTELEAFRKSINEEQTGAVKISPLILIIKAALKALERFPNFNSSLDTDGATLIHKRYYNIGIAVDSPGGLVVPVIKDADGKGILELAAELKDLSSRAREGGLKGDELRGGSFTISSLGGIGGTGFTPIVNAPETAILGLSKMTMKPVWNGEKFVPRLVLPFSVSYDHRVIDGAQGARFAVYLASVLMDMRRILL